MNGINKYNIKILGEIFSSKSYSLDLLSLLCKDPLIVDIGANIGGFALAANCYCQSAKFYLIEPDPGSFVSLKLNVATIAGAQAFNVALSGSNARVPFYVGLQDGVANSIILSAMTTDVPNIEVESRAMCEFLIKIQITEGRLIDVLKIDAEGAEWFLLSDLQFLSEIKLIFIEYHSSSFLHNLLTSVLQTHVIFSGDIRFPHRGELSLLRKDLVPASQNSFEIIPSC